MQLMLEARLCHFRPNRGAYHVTVRRASALLGLLLLACSTSSPPAPGALLRDSANAMAGLKTVSADVKFTAGKVTLQGFTLDSASTKVRLPSDSDTLFKVKQGDFLVNVRVVTISGNVYVQLPFSAMTQLPADQAKEVPDLSALFDSQHGLPAVLPSGRTPSLQGSEQLSGVDCYKVSTTYTADQVASLLGAFRPGGDVAAVLWIGQSDKLIREVTLTGPFEESGGKATVQVLLHDFNKPVEIISPAPAPAPSPSA
jgi:LppX_LprAFG lipoprotein